MVSRNYKLLFPALLLALLGGGPASAQSPSTAPLNPQHVEVNMYLGRGGKTNPAMRVAAQLKGQQPDELDAPLQVTSVRWLWDDEMKRLDGLVMQFGVEADGRPGNIRMMQVPLGSRKFGRDELSTNLRLNLIRLIDTWRFKPPLHNGKPVSFCCVRLVSQPQ